MIIKDSSEWSALTRESAPRGRNRHLEENRTFIFNCLASGMKITMLTGLLSWKSTSLTSCFSSKIFLNGKHYWHTSLPMVGVVNRALLVFVESRRYTSTRVTTRSWTPLSRSVLGFFVSQRKGGSVRNYLHPRLSWVGLFKLNGLDPSPFSRASKMDLLVWN